MEENLEQSSVQPSEETEPPVEESGPIQVRRKSRRGMVIAGGALALILLLGGAAFVAGRLLSQPEPAAAGPSSVMMSTNKNGAPQQFRIQTDPAKELPTSAPDAKGIFVRRDSNSIFIGTGKVSLMATKGADGTVQMSPNYDGPVLEVVVTHDTVVWEDATPMDPNSLPSGNLQQVVKPGSLDQIGENSTVTAWGQKRGDRIVADTLVYMKPTLFKNSGGK